MNEEQRQVEKAREAERLRLLGQELAVWRQDPMTQLFFLWLAGQREQLKEGLASGAFLALDAIAESRVIGQCTAYAAAAAIEAGQLLEWSQK